MFGWAVAMDTAVTPVSNDLCKSPGRLTSSPPWSDGEQASGMCFFKVTSEGSRIPGSELRHCR